MGIKESETLNPVLQNQLLRPRRIWKGPFSLILIYDLLHCTLHISPFHIFWCISQSICKNHLDITQNYLVKVDGKEEELEERVISKELWVSSKNRDMEIEEKPYEVVLCF